MGSAINLSDLGATPAPPPPAPAAPPASPAPQGAPAGGKVDLSDLGATPAAPAASQSPDSYVVQKPSGFFDQFGKVADAYRQGGIRAAVRQAVPAAEEYHQGGLPAVVRGTVDRVKGVGEGMLAAAAEPIRASHILDISGGLPKTLQDAAAAPPAEGARGEGQDVGRQMENLLEYELGSEAFKALTPAEKLTQMGKLAKVAERYPKLISAVARNATVAGAQSALHGGDTGDVLESAATGAGLGALTEGLPEAVQRKAREIAPRTREIAGESIPVLASQEPGASRAASHAADIATEPEIDAAQQAGATNATRNVARRATREHIARLNATRTLPVQTDPARLLPGDQAPYMFTVAVGDEPHFDRRAPITQDAELTPAGTTTRTVQLDPGAPATPETTPEDLAAGVRQENARAAVGSTAATVPDRMMPRNPTVQAVGTAAVTTPQSVFAERAPRAISVEEPLYRYAEPQGPAGEEVLTGGGTMNTADITVPRAQLSQLEQLTETQGFENLSPRLQSRVNSQIENLRQQLRDHAAYTPRFDPVDPEAAADQVHNFRDAADQLEGSVGDVYQKLDEVSDGEFSKLRKQQRAAERQIANAPDLAPGTVERAYKARQEATDGINRIFDKAPADQVQRQDWMEARRMWRMASAAREVHAALQSSFTGPPEDVAARTGLERRQVGGPQATNALNRALRDRGADIQELIGKDGVDGLYQVADLLKRPAPAEGLPKYLRAASMIMRRYGTGLGAAAAGYLAHGVAGALGHAIPGYAGLLAGLGGEAMYRRVVNEIATRPDLANRLAYPVKNGLPVRHIAPLMATMLLQGQHEDRAPQPASDDER